MFHCSFLFIFATNSASTWRCWQAFMNWMHSNNHARNMHANGVIRVQKFVHCIDWECNLELLIACWNRPLCFKKIKTTNTTAFLISNTLIPNPYSHKAIFSLNLLHPYLKFNRSVSVWYSSTLGLSNR